MLKTTMSVFKDSPLFAFTSTIYRLRRGWVQVVNGALAESGLSASMATVILFASRLEPNVQQKTLAQEVGVNPAAMVRLIDQGETAGLLTRSETPGDRRSKAINLTPKGHHLAMKMEDILMTLRKELTRDIPIQDIELATQVMRLFEERCIAYVGDNKE